MIFLALSTLIAVVPAYQMQATQPLPSMKNYTEDEMAGLHVYTAENCVACHTQQVRNIEMDEVWGDRPSMASDYYYSKQRLDVWRQSPSLLGSERTGPDLSNVGQRQPGLEWHLIHLYNPRIVSKASIMPSYPWLFTEKYSHEILENDVVLPVPDKYLNDTSKKVVATAKAMQLVAYLQSLKQAPLDGLTTVDFIPSQREEKNTTGTATSPLPDGAKLYTQTCSSCHQTDGKGLPGAFPALAGSPIVTAENPEQLVRIILQGYDARSEFGVMPSFSEQLSDEEIAAIANHERSSWGNKAPSISVEEVKKIRDYVQSISQ